MKLGEYHHRGALPGRTHRRCPVRCCSFWGTDPGWLPTDVRFVTGFAACLWLFAALLVLVREGTPLPRGLVRGGTRVLVGFWAWVWTVPLTPLLNEVGGLDPAACWGFRPDCQPYRTIDAIKLEDLCPHRCETLGVTTHGTDPRYSLANERTFLAWIRTSLGLLAAAAALVTVDVPWPPEAVRGIAAILATTAALSALFAWDRWRKVESAIAQDQPAPPPRVHVILSLTVAVVAGVTVVLPDPDVTPLEGRRTAPVVNSRKCHRGGHPNSPDPRLAADPRQATQLVSMDRVCARAALVGAVVGLNHQIIGGHVGSPTRASTISC